MKFLLEKVMALLFSLWAVMTLTFLMMMSIPGDPFIQEQPIPKEILESIYKHYGLDKPLHLQYLKYLKGAATFDLGPSYKYEGRQVDEIIAEGLPTSLTIGAGALAIATLVGISLGAIAAYFRSKWQDHLCMVIAVVGISVPGFLMATFFQYIFSIKLGWLPVARLESYAHTILPTLSLAAMPMAFIARLTRNNMIDVFEQDFIAVAYAKGLSTFQVFRKHVLKNSILPVVTYLGPLSCSILTGSFVIEKIFALPGLGCWFVSSIMNRDYTLIIGITLFYSILLLIGVFALDLIYPLIDPRISPLTKKSIKKGYYE